MNTTANANLFSRLFDGLDDPSRLAIETHDGQRISYGELIARAGQIANVLVARGVKPGDRVAAQTEKSVRASCSISPPCAPAASICRSTPPIRSTSSTISSPTPSRRWWSAIRRRRDGIAAIAAKVGAKVETLDADGTGSLTDARRQGDADFATVPRGNDDLAAILYTSGTTGRSKGAMLTPRQSRLELADAWSTTGASPTRTC